jgi:hypothetical protein
MKSAAGHTYNHMRSLTGVYSFRGNSFMKALSKTANEAMLTYTAQRDFYAPIVTNYKRVLAWTWPSRPS